MFTDMIADLNKGAMPDPASLKTRFDFALTKKTGVVKLPSAFWMRDPKINPRSDHLLWAALLLLDRSRIDLALAVIEEEHREVVRTKGNRSEYAMEHMVEAAIARLLLQVPDRERRRKLEDSLRKVVPEWMRNKAGNL